MSEAAITDEARNDPWDAVETAARIRKGEVSAREVIDTAIARAERAEHLGAIVTETYDRARAARSLDGPLAGVPTFIKDLAQVAGVRTAWGSRGAGAYVSEKSDPSVLRIEATGVISLGKSATPELGMTGTTEPVGQPPCRNPWDPTRSSGGSSGGAGCLVAAGVVPIAHASDGGGSIRIPASCCGLVGLKPSRGRFDMEGSNLLPVNVACHGVLSRTVRDTIAFWNAVERRAKHKIGDVRPEPSRALRIGIFVDAPLGTEVHPDNRNAALEAAKICEELGHEVESIPCPFEGWFTRDFMRYWGFVAFAQKRGAPFLIHRKFDVSKLEPWTVGLADYFWCDLRAALRSIRRLRSFGRIYASVMKSYDVLISPTLAEPPPLLGHLATDEPFAIAFERLQRYAPFTPIQNAAGAPAISLPLGRSAGLPIGVQLAAARGDERTLLELARAIETSRPWPQIAPPERWH